ncbi:MAG: 30S ribosome-binding factor RbfA [Candidatus Sungbacteria bacterium]|uniref:Ribosome-binding factor A n=1 Tax=Candidatus Sungiibacteriota bacterium TaxID=2750080 RepID=A0A9D6QS47_9BACT|nr:30S ribosome-binding factor RbfA [Candidatus Sungbacteria bacterium]
MRRIEQVNDLIRAELGPIMDREMEFPVDSLVTITRVVTSADLHYADIFLSVMPVASEGDVLAVLEKEVGKLQHLLNKKLRMRPVPRIKFMIDVEQKRADRIEKLLSKENLKERG